MGIQLFTNWPAATLAASITQTQTSIALTSGEGALFPALSGGNWFMGVLITATESASSSSEIVMVTARSTDTLTVVRAQEGTTAPSGGWAAGTQFCLLVTAGGLNNFVQPATLQAQTGNYASDVGSANAYSVTLTPALTAHVSGMPIRFLAGHTNTGTSTFNDGVAVGSLVLANGAVLPPGTIEAGGIYTATWNTTLAAFQLSGYSATLAQIGSVSYTGWGTNPNLDLYYSVRDGVVSLVIEQGTVGISNGTAFVISGLPSIITPQMSFLMVPVAGLLDNGAAVAGGCAIIQSSGQINFYKDATQPAWTSIGNKGFSVEFVSITYPLQLFTA